MSRDLHSKYCFVFDRFRSWWLTLEDATVVHNNPFSVKVSRAGQLGPSSLVCWMFSFLLAVTPNPESPFFAGN